ncbi:hypothetical protein [Furfurilactobacillus curtus]|uniref:Uncharacterized protein n=1 Tax=Furfurilactobacillus curtus TaxID=1746200 RepID=A0ABQ5JK74_9LACO
MDNKKRGLHEIHNRAYPVSDWLADRLVKYKVDNKFANYEVALGHLLALGIREQETLKSYEQQKRTH